MRHHKADGYKLIDHKNILDDDRKRCDKTIMMVVNEMKFEIYKIKTSNCDQDYEIVVEIRNCKEWSLDWPCVDEKNNVGNTFCTN